MSSKGSTAIGPPPPTVKCVSQLGHLDRETYAGPSTRNAPCSRTQQLSEAARSQRSPGMDKDEPMLRFSGFINLNQGSRGDASNPQEKHPK